MRQILTANNITKCFTSDGKKITVANNVCFFLNKNEFCSLVGESGSGKTTLVRIMSGLISPDSGDVICDGENITPKLRRKNKALCAKLQLVLQNSRAALDPRFSVYDCIAEPIRNLKKCSREEERKIVWQHTPSEAGHLQPFNSHYFYSPFISGAQRLPNGNTLITEGSGGRLMEVTKNHELVWEYISPYVGQSFPVNMIYRAYRYPYDYVPQVEKPTETAIYPVDVTDFRMPGAKGKAFDKVTTVPGVWGYGASTGFCVEKEE